MSLAPRVLDLDERLSLVATYRRTLPVSIKRIWENALDWEHLPWLHRTSFQEIELLEGDPDGWRARVVTAPPASAEMEIDLRRDRAAGRYLVRTLAGPGKDSAVLTTLEPVARRRTAIEVGFYVPDPSPEARDAIGAGYVRLYSRLWDEDEQMMVRRQELLDASRGRAVRPPVSPRPVPLGPVESLRARLPLVVGEGHGRVRVLEVGGTLIAHSTVCAHKGGPLDAARCEDGVIVCPWHGYRFDVASGKSADGRGLALRRAPTLHVDAASSEVTLVWPDP